MFMQAHRLIDDPDEENEPRTEDHLAGYDEGQVSAVGHIQS